MNALIPDRHNNDEIARDGIEHFLVTILDRISINEFLDLYDAIFPLPRDNSLIKLYRIGRNEREKPDRLKRLKDEVSVVAHFLRQTSEEFDQVQFFMNSDIPDARLWRKGRAVDVEVTQILAKARLAIMKELNAKGFSAGFPLLDENSPLEDFEAELASGRSGFTTEKFRQVIIDAVDVRLRKKARSERKGYLLIWAPIGNEFIPQRSLKNLQMNVPDSGFDRVVLVDRDRIMQIGQPASSIAHYVDT